MNDEFVAYLLDIGLSQTLIGRISQLYDLYKALVPEPFDRIFVEDFIDESGGRQYPALWFFSKNYLYEIGSFVEKDSLLIIPIDGAIDELRLTPSNYDFITPQATSKLTVTFTVSLGLTASLVASRKNCTYLIKLIRDYHFKRFYSEDTD